MAEEILAFEAGARLALFRRAYTNVTSLSYRFPPRNTITGIIASILGLGRDSYYGEFSRERCNIAVQILTAPRGVNVTTNYIDTDSGITASAFKRNRQQIVVEYIAPEEGFLRYRIFLHHRANPEIMRELRRRINGMEIVYPVSLGPAHCLGFVENAELLECRLVHRDSLDSITVVPARDWEPVPERNKGRRVVLEEALPPDFTDGREPVGGTGGNFYYEADGKPVFVKAKSGEGLAFSLEGGEMGVFLSATTD